MRKELVQHDERLEKEREDAKRRDADLCSQRPGDLLQNLVQTSVTKALTDMGHVTDTQDEPEEVDGEKRTQAIANTIRGNGQSPGGRPGAQYKRERNEEEKTTKKQRHSQGERQRARARTGTSANERKPEEARQEEQNQGPGQGQRQRERNKPSKQTSMERVSTRRKGKRQRRPKEKDHECSELTVHEFGTRCDTCASSLTKARGAMGSTPMIMKPRGVSHVSRCRGQSPGCWGDSTLSTAMCTSLHLQNPSESSALISNAKCCGDGTVTPRGSWMGMHLWRISNMPVAEYPKLPSPELRLWLSNLRQAVMGASERVKNMYAEGCGTRNMLGITRLGFKMLRESEICAMPCDKEGLFCTMPTTVPFLLHKGVFETSGYYEACDPEEPHESSALKGYRSLSRRISKLEPDQSSQASMAVAINRSWRGDRRFYSNLITNIKSHKPDGEVWSSKHSCKLNEQT